MQFSVRRQGDDPNRVQLDAVDVTHGDEKITFGLSSAGRRNFVNLDLLFRPVNALLENYNEDQLDIIFGCYRRAEQLHNIKLSAKDTADELRDVIATLTSIITPLGVEAWGTTYYSGFEVPETITDERKPGHYSPNSSYDKHEYRALCALSTFFKTLLPVVFRFMDIFANTYTPAMKEFYLFMLIDQDELGESTAYTKLVQHTLDILSDNKDEVIVPMGLMTEGIDATMYPSFVLASKLLRDLTLAETDVGDRGDAVNNIAAKITKGINQSRDSVRTRFDYATKTPPQDRLGREDNNVTLQEDVGSKEPYSYLYRKAVNYDVSQETLWKRYEVDEKLYQECLHRIRSGVVTMNAIKFTMVSIVLSTFVDPEGLASVHGKEFATPMAITAAYLHKLELYELAAFMMSQATPLGETINSAAHAAITAKPNQELLAEARKHYPEAYDGYNMFDRWLEEYTKELIRNNWVNQLPEIYHESYGVGRPYVPSKGFKDALITLNLHYINKHDPISKTMHKD